MICAVFGLSPITVFAVILLVLCGHILSYFVILYVITAIFEK